jgi:hypothetical protein
MGDRRQETGNRRQETGDRRQETGDRRQETGNRKQEPVAITGNTCLTSGKIANNFDYDSYILYPISYFP